MKTLILTFALIIISLNSFGQSKINDVPRTKKITSIQYGVTCGKTGKSAIYVYHKEKTAKGFNPKTDREIVYVENISNLQRTVEYQYYLRNI